MVNDLIELCEEVIQALKILRHKNLISEKEFKSHLENKITFINKYKLN